MEDGEYKQRLKVLMDKLIPKGSADNSETTELFLLYNLRLKPRETGRSCPACRSRVFKRMVEYYKQLWE